MPQVLLFNYLELQDVGSILSASNEPGKDDISYLLEVASEMPRTQEQVEDFAASYLASVSLVAFQRCNELKTKATVYCGNKKVDLDAKYGSLIATSEKPATITKEISKSNVDYVALAKEHEKAKAYVEFYTGLMGQFEKCHYWAKSKEASNNQELKSSSYEPHDARTNVKSNEGEEAFLIHKNGDPKFGKAKTKSITPVEDVNLF